MAGETDPQPSGQNTSTSVRPPVDSVAETLKEEPVEEIIPVVVTEDMSLPRYEIIIGGSVKSGDLLADNWGYTYSRKVTDGLTTRWTCSSRGQKCRATVKQYGPDMFIRGLHDHSHASDVEKVVRAKTRALVKKAARSDFFSGSSEVVMGALQKVPTGAMLFEFRSLQRTANRARQTLRPKHPTTLDFELDMSHVPERFLQKDISLGAQRHLIFGSPLQFSYLAQAKIWFIDGTSKVVRDPFVRLLTIHSFVRSGESLMQVPLGFILMSRHKKRDYKTVFNAILELLPSEPSVEEIVLDFERAVWRAIQQCLPATTLHGCSFHWAQAVYRKLKEFGLRSAYIVQSPVRQFIRELMALPNLPGENIAEAFQQLKARCPRTSSSGGLLKLLNYLDETWISSSSCPPTSWTTWKRTVRTHNDVEGWHNRLSMNSRTNRPNLYQLIKLLQDETALLPLQVRMIPQRKLCRGKSKEAESKQAALKELWKAFEAQQLTNSEYLRQCAALIDHTEE